MSLNITVKIKIKRSGNDTDFRHNNEWFFLSKSIEKKEKKE